ncbi:uncharacterized protein LOC131938718 [Physella acuta]|uniref:uncharacterized protein LOC131938718 n=1 Tax=Physella acuta TaxID=109671 RepID=UPI0027DD94EE|nr:uncharacterized protein LOC131938718 [Physella acuta]
MRNNEHNNRYCQCYGLLEKSWTEIFPRSRRCSPIKRDKLEPKQIRYEFTLLTSIESYDLEMSSPQVTATDTGAIYHELTPKLVWIVRLINVATLCMMVIAVILCFVQGHKNGSFYLLVCNLIISAIVCGVVNWWYKSGDLGSEKYWFVILVAVVIFFQCISTDVFVFKEEPPPAMTTTPSPHTLNWTTMLPPSTRQAFQNLIKQ